MAKSLVEKYEQILAQDPASTVFVELAKALIEKGDNARAIEVCQRGLEHHASSVVGRVLWGKALINLGRPAEAMEQFDKAIAIDRENPHAYNLIGEVLLHKGLYRSALPLLRKAVVLQPNDGRVRQWLEQTQAALAGGPAPVLADITQVDSEPLPDATTANNPILPSTEVDRETTEVAVPAYVPASSPAQPSAPATPAAATAAAAAIERTDEASGKRPAPERQIPVLHPAAAPAPAAASSAAPQADASASPSGDASDDPFAAVPKRTQSSDVIGGLTATFNALSEGPAPTPAAAGDGAADPFDAVARRSPAPRDDEERGETVPLQVGPPPKAAPPIVDEPSVAVSNELYMDGRVEHHTPGKSSGGGLLGDLPDLEDEAPPAPAPAATRGAARPAGGPPVLSPVAPASAKPHGGTSGGGLLGDIPELAEPTSSLEVPKVEVSASAAEAIAREYERELREKLAQSKAKKSFLARHWLKLSAGGVAALVVIVGAIIYVRTLTVNQGSLQDALADAKKAITQDTRASYGAALDALARAARMDEDVVEIWALSAYTHGLLYAEHGGKPEHKRAGEAALRHPGVREQFPELALPSSYYLGEAKDRAERSQQVIASPVEEAEVAELAGRLLLEKGEAKRALEKFTVALQNHPRNARVLVALGDYYRASGDFPKALEFYGKAAEVSPKHPGGVLGAAESRLELDQDLATSLAEVEALPEDEVLSEEHRWRRTLARGRLLAATGSAEQGIAMLKSGLERFKLQGFEFQLALGHAYRKAGRMGDAEVALEAAVKLRPRNEDAREALIRVLVDRDKPREAVNSVAADADSRRVSLARGVAYARLADWKRARAEFERTQLNGKFPSEAVIHLALADSIEGDAAVAQQHLEKTLAVTRKARSEVLVALGDIHLRKGELDKAKARYEEASRDPEDVEGACAYGRLLMQLGFPELALEPLERATRRNDSHNEAHEALARAYLQLGRLAEATELIGRWREVNGAPAASHRLHALALYQAGKVKEADKVAAVAVKAQSENPEAWRIRAAINFAQGDSKTAFKDLERANKLDPKDAETFCEIGHAFLRAGNPEGAEAAFGAALRENKDSACGQVGVVYAKLPSANRAALKDLEAVAKDASAVWDKAFAHTTRSRILLATGKAKEAKEAADEAVKLAPWSAPAHLALALAQQRLKDAAARDTLARGVALDPANGAIRLAYADVLAKGNDEEQAKALDEYERFLQIGGSEDDVDRVEKTLKSLKKRLAAR